MNSAIYEGWVRHRRETPAIHAFQHRLFMVLLDLSELETVFDCHPFWSTQKMALVRFRRDDHLGPPETPLADSVRDLVKVQTGFRPNGPVRLLTNLRHFGYIMNPVSFYFCYAQDGRTLTAFVAEVHNTPWNEQHCYAFAIDADQSSGTVTLQNPKEFHVSPFMDMASIYKWTVMPPAEQLQVRIACRRADKQIFDARLELEKRELNRRSLTTTLLRYPVMTGKIIAAIYWHALRLWIKRVPYVPHPQNRIHTGVPFKDAVRERNCTD